jgi:hypothetical protein
MVETSRSLHHDGEWNTSVFECNQCGIDFFTEDHIPLTGLPSPPDTARSREIFHTISPTRH